MRILHLTPHLGGGVGTVVRALIGELSGRGVDQRVLSLDGLNDESKLLLDSMSLEWSESVDLGGVDFLVAWADIVIVHWWNHPLLSQLLVNHNLPPARIVFWCHISGEPAPNNLTGFVLDFPDRFVFTTPLSYLTPHVQRLSASRREALSTIWSTAGVERLAPYMDSVKVEKKACYVGSLDYTKLHSGFVGAVHEFLESSLAVTIIGPPTKDFLEDLHSSEHSSSPTVLGYVSEVEKFRELSSSVVFPYPLARHHYATCDQALQEAMALGAVPVVLNNSMESYMVQDGVTGVVASSIPDFVRKTRDLAEDELSLRTLATKARAFAAQAYSIVNLGSSWMVCFESMMQETKRSHLTPSVELGRTLSPHEVFLHSLGDYSGPFRWDFEANSLEEKRLSGAQVAALSSGSNWTSVSKSSPSHFSAFFPSDPWLLRWSALVRPEL